MVLFRLCTQVRSALPCTLNLQDMVLLGALHSGQIWLTLNPKPPRCVVKGQGRLVPDPTDVRSFGVVLLLYPWIGCLLLSHWDGHYVSSYRSELAVHVVDLLFWCLPSDSSIMMGRASWKHILTARFSDGSFCSSPHLNRRAESLGGLLSTLSYAMWNNRHQSSLSLSLHRKPCPTQRKILYAMIMQAFTWLCCIMPLSEYDILTR